MSCEYTYLGRTYSEKEMRDYVQKNFKEISDKHNIPTYSYSMHLNGERLNANSPIHESGHIFLKWAETNRPQLHTRGMELIENSKYLKEVKADENYIAQADNAGLGGKEREDFFKNEALATAIGDKGERFISDARKKSFKDWLNNLWEGIKQHFGIRDLSVKEIQNLTLDEFSKKVAADILSGKELETGKPKFRVAAEQGAKVEGDVSKTDERRFTQQMLADQNLSDEAKAQIGETLDYTRQTNKLSVKEAGDIIDKVGVDEALNFVTTDKDIKPAVRVTLGQVLIKKYNDLAKGATDGKVKNHYLDKTIQTAKFVTEKLATEPGQMIQAFSMWSRLSPEAQLRSATKDAAEQGKNAMRKRSGDIKSVSDKLKKANEETADELTQDASIKKAVEKTDVGKKAKEKIEQARKKREDLIKKYKGDKGKNLYSTAPGLTVEGIEFVGNVARTYIDEGLGNLELIVDKVLAHLKDVSGKPINDTVRKNVEDIIKTKLNDEPFAPAEDRSIQSSHAGESDKDINKRIASAQKNLEKQIGDIIRKHYTVAAETKTELVDKFMEQAGLPKAEAEKLSKEIQEEFDRIATRKKQDILRSEQKTFERIAKSGGKKIDPNKAGNDLIKYSNLGAFGDKEFTDLVKNKFGIGELTKEQVEKITELSEKIAAAPEGTPKRDATEDLLAYKQNLKGSNPMETAQAIWYANILSGYKTHEKNVVSTFFSTAAALTSEMATDPKSIPYLMYGFIRGVGLRGSIEAAHTVKTGRSPIHIQKIETPQALERKSFIGGGFNPANWFKYVGRLMTAEDVLQFQGLKEARAYQLARREVAKQGLNTWSKKGWDKVNEVLLNTKDRYAFAEDLVKNEGVTNKLEKIRRIQEIMEDSRPLDMVENSYGFAAHGTFNHESEGTLGAVTNAIAAGLDAVSIGGAKPLRLIVPFTRIITNVVNNSLDYSPVGLIRAARGVRGFRGFEKSSITKSAFKELSGEERRTLIAKASLGIALAGTLQALHQSGAIQITGAGTDDFKKNAQLRQEGWQEYSIKIGDTWYSYKLTPLVFTLGFLGNMNDAAKYAAKEDKKTMLKRMEVAGSRLGGQFAEMTWINSAGTFLGALMEPKAEAAASKINSSIANTVSGFIPFRGAITQTSQEVQNIWNMPQKQVDNAWQAMVQDIPIARNSLNDKVNALGDPVVRDVDIFTSEEKKDAIWKYLLDKQGWVAPVNKKSFIVWDKETKQDRQGTNDEYYEFSKIRGRKIKKEIEKIMQHGATVKVGSSYHHKSADEMTPAELNSVLTPIETEATKFAKYKLHK